MAVKRNGPRLGAPCAKYPGDFATTKAEKLAWHRAMLGIATKKKSWSAALSHLTKLTEIDPENWEDRLARARLLGRLERWDEAEAEFTRAVEGHPAVLPVWVARGSFFLGRGQRDRAEADFVRAIELDASPELPAALERVLGRRGLSERPQSRVPARSATRPIPCDPGGG